MRIKSYFSAIIALSLLLTASGCRSQTQVPNQSAPLAQTVASQSASGPVTQLRLQSTAPKVGKLALKWDTLKSGFGIQSTQADIQSLQLTLSGALINTVNQGSSLNVNLNFGQGNHTISNIPQGTIDIAVTAFGAGGEVLGTASVSGVAILAGQVSQVQLNLQLKDTVVVEEVTNTGDLALGLGIQDGQNIVQQQQVDPEGGYLLVGGQAPAGPPPAGPDCPLPPPPPQEVMATIQSENAALAAELQAMQSLTFMAFHQRMVELAAQYPQYFAPPPPLPADGSCPPPPPGGNPPPPQG